MDASVTTQNHSGSHHHDHAHGHGEAGCCSHDPHDGHAHKAAPIVETARPLQAHGHAHATGGDPCDCVGHRMQARRSTGEKLSGLSAILPILACAVCPVCLSAYATILSALGVGLAITEGQHAILLGVAVVLALASGLWRARITRLPSRRRRRTRRDPPRT